MYTYQLNNTKYQMMWMVQRLAGAGFRLYSDEACTPEQEVNSTKKASSTTPSKTQPIKPKTLKMFSDENGQFNVQGLDAGTYYLKGDQSSCRLRVPAVCQ